jgi:hypothetical protein
MDFISFFPTIGTSPRPKEFDKSCMLSFSKLNKSIESKKIVQKTHGITKQLMRPQVSC